MPQYRRRAAGNRFKQSSSVYELQDLSQPFKMSSYLPPPPIAASTVALPSRSAAPPLSEPDALLALHRREEQLQADLQHLLDAQSDGLIAGLGTGPESVPDDLLSNGSSTPTPTTSFRTGSLGSSATVAEARRPKPKKIGLSGARRGLWKTIRKLASVKLEEISLINGEVEENREVLGTIDAWEQKREGLQNSIANIAHASEEGARANSLRHEAHGLDVEIQELEARLAEMKSRHRMMLQEISRLENSLQARLSSYRESLGIVENEIRGFLDRPPVDRGKVVSGDTRKKGKAAVDDFMALRPRRRTLEMARSHWEDCGRSLERQREAVEFEKEALEEGAVVWKDVVDEVMQFEGNLRRYMSSMSPVGHENGKEEKEEDLKEFLKSMDQTIIQVESKFKLAEARDWKLLVCCIGAELDAFRQGKEILEGALVDEGPPVVPKSESSPPQTDFHGLNGGLLGQDPAAMTSSKESVLHRGRVKEQTYDTEDDEPDPELLISRKDTNTFE